jgi:hypothetical protein
LTGNWSKAEALTGVSPQKLGEGSLLMKDWSTVSPAKGHHRQQAMLLTGQGIAGSLQENFHSTENREVKQQG